MALELEGKRVLISGGTTGIGRATAHLLASQGARVFIFGRHLKELDEALTEISLVGKVEGMVADQANHEDVLMVFREVDKTFGGLDILINNASIAADTIFEIDFDDLMYVLKSNLVGYMDCTREAVARMKKTEEGHIINISSLSAVLREGGADLYVATKGAISAYTESIRKQLNKFGIRITLVEPGLVGTDLINMPQEEQEKMIAQHKMLRPDDLARCIYFSIVQPVRTELVLVRVKPHQQNII